MFVFFIIYINTGNIEHKALKKPYPNKPSDLYFSTNIRVPRTSPITYSIIACGYTLNTKNEFTTPNKDNINALLHILPKV